MRERWNEIGDCGIGNGCDEWMMRNRVWEIVVGG